MSGRRSRRSPCVALSIVLILSARAASFAENIDPDGDGSRYAWSENLGWINARPGGPGGPGVQVTNTGLTGWMWSENAGWIHLSGAGYGVTNNGCGTLSGRAWSENTGWIDFAPTTCQPEPSCGVEIGATTGIFAGRAWAENAGWITFSAAAPTAYRVTTSWRPTAPTGAPNLAAAKAGASDVTLSWPALPGSARYDVVQGSLSALRSTGGGFQAATQACAVDDTPANSFTSSAAPSAGDGIWFLVRGVNCGGAGTFDSGAASQAGPRDAEIAASGENCP